MTKKTKQELETIFEILLKDIIIKNPEMTKKQAESLMLSLAYEWVVKLQ